MQLTPTVQTHLPRRFDRDDGDSEPHLHPREARLIDVLRGPEPVEEPRPALPHPHLVLGLVCRMQRLDPGRSLKGARPFKGCPGDL